MQITKCKYCENKSFYTRESGPHIGLYCSVCGKWQKWLKQKEAELYSNQDKIY